MTRCRHLAAASLAAWLVAGASGGAVLAQARGPVGLGAVTPVFEDDFTQPGTWDENEDERGSLAYDAGTFRISIALDDAALWSLVDFPTKEAVLLVEGDVTLGPDPGLGGLMCASDVDANEFLLGVIGTDREWAIIHVDAGVPTLLTYGLLPETLDPAGSTMRLALECAATGSEADHVALRVEGGLVGEYEAAPRIRPFDMAGLYATATRAPFSARFDDVALRSGAAYRPPAVTTFGATEAIVSDDFSQPGWSTPSTDVGSIAYVDEALRIGVSAPASHMWSWCDLTAASPVMRIEGMLELEGSGAAGFMCGPAPEADEPEFLVGTSPPPAAGGSIA